MVIMNNNLKVVWSGEKQNLWAKAKFSSSAKSRRRKEHVRFLVSRFLRRSSQTRVDRGGWWWLVVVDVVERVEQRSLKSGFVSYTKERRGGREEQGSFSAENE